MNIFRNSNNNECDSHSHHICIPASTHKSVQGHSHCDSVAVGNGQGNSALSPLHTPVHFTCPHCHKLYIRQSAFERHAYICAMKYNRQMPSNTTHMKTHVNSQMNTHKNTKNGHHHNHGNVYGHENGHGHGHGHENGVDTDNCVLNQQCLHMLTELMSEVKSLRGEVGHLKSLLTPSTRNSHFSSHSSCKIKILEHESHTYGSETEGYEDDGNEGSVENEDEDDGNEGSVENEDDENDGGDEDESDDLVLSDTGNEGAKGAVEVQYNSNDYTFDKFMTHVSFCNQSQLMDVFESDDIIESFFYLWNETVTTFYAKNDHCLPLKYNSQQNMMYHFIAPQMNENTNTNTIMNSNMHTTPSWECMTYHEIQRMVKYLVSKIMGELKVYQTTHRSVIDSNITFRDKYMDHVHIVSTASEKLIQQFKKNPGQFIRLLGANIR